VTAGDKVIKVWDYHMRLDINFQVPYRGMGTHCHCIIIIGIVSKERNISSDGYVDWQWNLVYFANEYIHH